MIPPGGCGALRTPGIPGGPRQGSWTIYNSNVSWYGIGLDKNGVEAPPGEVRTPTVLAGQLVKTTVSLKETAPVNHWAIVRCCYCSPPRVDLPTLPHRDYEGTKEARPPGPPQQRVSG